MKPGKFSPENLFLYAVGAILCAWLGLLTAPYLEDGLAGVVRNLGSALEDPLRITWCEYSLKAVFLFLLFYGIALGVYLSDDKNYRRREEHGSAKWGVAIVISRRYADRNVCNNIILTRHVIIGLDGRKHRRNLNILICGGSGSGKTRFYAKPNILNANTSFVILDPNGYNIRG